MELHYITDSKGRKSAIQLKIKDWNHILEELKELEKLRDKKAFFADLIESVEEVKLAKQGKLKLQSAKEFLDEL